jgi:hypothetical protein
MFRAPLPEDMNGLFGTDERGRPGLSFDGEADIFYPNGSQSGDLTLLDARRGSNERGTNEDESGVSVVWHGGAWCWRFSGRFCERDR